MRAGGFESGNEAKNDTGHKRDEKSESQNTPVDFEIVQKRGERDSPDRIERGQNRNQPVGENHTSDAAKEGQKHALGEKLPNKAPTSGAERATQCQFPLACDAAGQLQIRHIGATNQ